MFSAGDGVIRYGDATTHGGRVIEASGYMVNGKQAALVGDKVTCPKHGVCSIIEGHPAITFNGRLVAFHGATTSCGARVRSSQDHAHCLGTWGSISVGGYPASSAAETASQRYSEQFRLVSASGAPLPCRPYVLIREDGRREEGVTDTNGYTHRLREHLVSERVQVVMSLRLRQD